MHKVIVERPRNGGGYDKPRLWGNLPLEEWPQQESIYARHSRRKRFSEHLGPLRRWLRSQIGRPWNDAYSEACRVIKPDNVVRAHIKFHLLEMVERNTFMRDGVVWCYHGSCFRGRTELPVAALGSRWVVAYVHPESGLICGLVFKRRRRFVETRMQPEAATRLWLVDGRVLLRLKGLWFVCEVRAFPERIERGDRPFRFDLATHRMLTRSAAESFYGRPVYSVAKRQLSRRELAAHRLRNDPLASLVTGAFPPVVAGPSLPVLRLSRRVASVVRAGHDAGFPVGQVFHASGDAWEGKGKGRQPPDTLAVRRLSLPARPTGGAHAAGVRRRAARPMLVGLTWTTTALITEGGELSGGPPKWTRQRRVLPRSEAVRRRQSVRAYGSQPQPECVARMAAADVPAAWSKATLCGWSATQPYLRRRRQCPP